MRIFIVCNNLGRGGAERVGVSLANGFSQNNHQVFIITDIYQEANYPISSKVQIFPMTDKKDGKLKKWCKAVMAVRKYVRQEKPDVIIGIMDICTFLSYIATLGLSIPVIMTEHNSFERPASAPLTLRKIIFKFWINKIYKNITVLTEADKLFIGKRLKNVTVMPNPLFLTPIKMFPPKEKIVLAAGRIDDWHYKGFDILLQAWGKIMRNDNWWLKIAGAGKKENFEYLMGLLPDGEWVFNDNVNDDDDHLKTKHIKEKNTSAEQQKSQKSGVWRSEKYHIEFLGFQKDMESLYKKSEIFVLSSRYEGFGLVLIEAMSQGCAPVACDYKGRQKEIIASEKGGLICQPEDVDELASNIERLINNDSLRKEIQKNAIQRSNFYALDNIILRWENLLNDLQS